MSWGVEARRASAAARHSNGYFLNEARRVAQLSESVGPPPKSYTKKTMGDASYTEAKKPLSEAAKRMLSSAGRKMSEAKTFQGKSLRPGGGGRFAKVKASIAKGGARNPGAVAAFLGRKKYGGTKMAKFSAMGRHRAAKKG